MFLKILLFISLTHLNKPKDYFQIGLHLALTKRAVICPLFTKLPLRKIHSLMLHNLTIPLLKQIKMKTKAKIVGPMVIKQFPQRL